MLSSIDFVHKLSVFSRIIALPSIHNPKFIVTCNVLKVYKTQLNLFYKNISRFRKLKMSGFINKQGRCFFSEWFFRMLCVWACTFYFSGHVWMDSRTRVSTFSNHTCSPNCLALYVEGRCQMREYRFKKTIHISMPFATLLDLRIKVVKDQKNSYNQIESLRGKLLFRWVLRLSIVHFTIRF